MADYSDILKMHKNMEDNGNILFVNILKEDWRKNVVQGFITYSYN